MPVRHPILNGIGCLGLGESAAKMIDASVDTIVKEQDELSVEVLRKVLKELVERENVPHVKGGRYHEPPRDLKKKKKAKRRKQKQSHHKR